MAEEIISKCSDLTIDDEEGTVIDLGGTKAPEDGNNIDLMLIGRLLTEKSYNVEAFKRTMTKIWAPAHGLAIRVLSPNLYALQFFHWKDKEKVLIERPWCFDNVLILLKEIEGDEQPEQVKITHSPFWVRIKNLPFNCRSDEDAKALMKSMGDVLELEEDKLGIGRYRRVKVLLDVRKPLRRFQKIKDKRGREIQVDYAYERLPFFCFACGRMGHTERDCHDVTEEEKKMRLGWGTGLKATPRKGHTKEVEEMEEMVANKKTVFVTKSLDKHLVEKEIIKKLLLENEGRIGTSATVTNEEGQNENEANGKTNKFDMIRRGEDCSGVGEFQGKASMAGPVQIAVPPDPIDGTIEMVAGFSDDKKKGGKWKRNGKVTTQDSGMVQRVLPQKRNLESKDKEGDVIMQDNDKKRKKENRGTGDSLNQVEGLGYDQSLENQ